ncbi:hypothetical protein IW140_006152 [Coemansia sp. RSA 1813]|nr:hypothetical protein EV178_002450 [Coemansia sp. RSA 1646]KAJ1766687.1 hypothetical protein LPJ74_005753 [Coemansia sp. RSA 1843]KAJ2085780.1 hypothetical protein IW138_006116 [Coemansia sp. RSA 986]KAJ2211920.1 hypothetical protein EV179_005090 [Coemansia sp. RSA 487]KAJ2563339.1 hypothetical protein IW140_006152 [Coemansia sp. RSA 1813]
MARLTDLPFELLLEFLLRSGNEHLVSVNRWTYLCLRPALTPRTCYRFVREKGRWLKGHVIASSLPYRFLTTDLLSQIERNENELVSPRRSKERKSKRQVKDIRVEEIKIPSRLFQFAEDHPLPATCHNKTKQNTGRRGKKRKRSRNDGNGSLVNPNQTRFDLVCKLLKLKLSVEGAKGSTGLVMAARAGNLPMVRLLLRHGADTTSAGSSDSKALLMAVVYGHLEVVKKLVRAGAPVSSLALRYAVQKKHSDIISWLMEKGAAPDMLTIKLLDTL